MSDIEYKGAFLRISGQAVLPEGKEYEHGDEVYVIGRIRIGEVSFPEKDGSVSRVHKAKMSRVTLVEDSEDAEMLIAKAQSALTGQGSIYEHLQPETKPALKSVSDNGNTSEAVAVEDLFEDEEDDDEDEDDEDEVYEDDDDY